MFSDVINSIKTEIFARSLMNSGMCWKNLDLWFLFPDCWFINGHLDGFLIIGNYDGSESAVLGVDLFIIDGPEPVEQQTLLIPAEKRHRERVFFASDISTNLPYWFVCWMCDPHQSVTGTILSSGWFPTMWSMKLRCPGGLLPEKENHKGKNVCEKFHV